VTITLRPEGQRSCVSPPREGTNWGVVGSGLFRLFGTGWCLGNDRREYVKKRQEPGMHAAFNSQEI